MKSYQQLFAEMKRRKVFKVAGVYGVVSFGLIQVADPLAGILRLPESFLPFVVGLLLLGFPLALVLAWAFEVTPDGVRRTEMAAPGEIERIVAQPFSKRWPAGLLALVGVAALVAGAWWAGRRSAPSPAVTTDVDLAIPAADTDARPSLAVLPFVDMSPERDQEYFSDGMTEEILNTLAGIREIKVAARTSAFAFKGQSPDMRTVGDSLNVQYVIEGSVRKAGNQLRITAQLIDASDGTHLWSEAYDRTLDDVFAIQTEIAQAIASELTVPLGLDEASRLVHPTDDLEAYDLYLAGRARLRERGGSLPEAIRLFEAAVARDSTWAPAWAGLAEAREVIGWYPEVWEGGPPRTMSEGYRRFFDLQTPAAAAARRALALDPDNASAHVALGSVYRNRREWSEARTEYETALELDPENAEAYLQYAQLLMSTGALVDAIHAAERSVVLDRLPISLRVLAAARLIAGQYEQALEELDRSDPHRTGHRNLESWVDASANVALGRYEALRNLPSPASVTYPPEEIERSIRALQAGDIDAIPLPLVSPVTLMKFGRADEAAKKLLSDFRTNPTALGIHWMPLFDSIREHPAYLELLKEANLEGVAPDRPTT
ncbi:MAG TPA: tetratricopeptide repeat protein [Gemmatimonadota bacterium]|nr:tetratricopeptide repeat protein [Gemmatimonadota bacterium]